jgi:holo-[acyl-carrier protein] synthase
MVIVGHGVDIVEVERVARMLEQHGQRFLDRVFTPEEQAYAAQHVLRAERLAGRFAAKEAILKALGTGWRNGIAWTDAQIVREPSGRPCVRLEHECQRIADALGIRHWSLSISHNKVQAIASAIAMGP